VYRGLALALGVAYILLALGPPTQADALDYHWGVPVYLIRHQKWTPTDLWLHESLSGIGEVYILLGMLIYSENLSTLLQAIGVVGIAYWLTQNKSKIDASILQLFILGCPILIFFVTGPKPQLFPQVITALALYLTVQKERLDISTYSLIILFVCGAAQQKLSFVLTGGVIGMWAKCKIIFQKPQGI
jgi:hypothetical protein